MGSALLIKRGAEAVLRLTEWRGRKAVEKSRVVKGYRDAGLDAELRASRIKTEVRLFREARRLGVPVPIVYDVDLEENKITMEFVEGPTVKEVITSGLDGLDRVCHQIGHLVARLHAGDLVHGDLTTSNMILSGDRLYLVDFGLGEKTIEVEAKGVDLHLFREAFQSAHSERIELFSSFLEGYREAFEGADEVIAKMREIERRGRYLRGS